MDEKRSESPPKIRRKSFRYETNLTRVADRAGMLRSPDKPEFRIASPPEFKGEAGVWTPEDLFVAAVECCTMTTFCAFSLRLGLPVESYASDAEGLLEFADGGYRFTRVVVRPRIVVTDADAVPAVEQAIHDAHRHCLIGNSILAKVEVNPTVVVKS